jgi:hypothetical protein
MGIMPLYKIHRMKENHRQQFRWKPHTAGLSHVKPRDYEPGETVEASSEYAAWLRLREAGQPFQVGDILEIEGTSLRIYKYIGFEEARWVVPEQAPPPAPESVGLPGQPGGL